MPRKKLGRCHHCGARTTFTFCGWQTDYPDESMKIELWNCDNCGSTVVGKKVRR
jgi:DNA-directed RNA polymerase subunit RPC12/RpoP